MVHIRVGGGGGTTSAPVRILNYSVSTRFHLRLRYVRSSVTFSLEIVVFALLVVNTATPYLCVMDRDEVHAKTTS